MENSIEYEGNDLGHINLFTVKFNILIRLSNDNHMLYSYKDTCLRNLNYDKYVTRIVISFPNDFSKMHIFKVSLLSREDRIDLS